MKELLKEPDEDVQTQEGHREDHRRPEGGRSPTCQPWTPWGKKARSADVALVESMLGNFAKNHVATIDSLKDMGTAG